MNAIEIYSFVGWIATFLVYICFILWVFMPSDVLQSVGITYYPSRYYAIALPAYVIVVYVLLGISYMAYNMINTVNPTDYKSFRDGAEQGRSASLVCQKFDVGEGIPDIADIDPEELSKLWK
jgi:phosphatidylinositol glycan class P protein